MGRGHRQKEHQRAMFTVNKVPGFATQLRRESPGRSGMGGYPMLNSQRGEASSTCRNLENGLRSRDQSPKTMRPRSEEIPLEDMHKRKTSLTSNGIATLIATPDRQENVPSASTASGETLTVLKQRSEETSFTSTRNKDSKPRRKGQVETV